MAKEFLRGADRIAPHCLRCSYKAADDAGLTLLEYFKYLLLLKVCPCRSLAFPNPTRMHNLLFPTA